VDFLIGDRKILLQRRPVNCFHTLIQKIQSRMNTDGHGLKKQMKIKATARRTNHNLPFFGNPLNFHQFFSRAEKFLFLGIESLRCEDSNPISKHSQKV